MYDHELYTYMMLAMYKIAQACIHGLWYFKLKVYQLNSSDYTKHV